jgi:glycosyltransferase involved in cell wall biosynthesis
MEKRKLLYLGNKAASFGGTVTTMESLSRHLISEGFDVVTASSKKNKVFRLWDMIFTVFKHAPSVHCVLIDTYSTQNFYYAVTIGNICRLLKLSYIPILHGGNLPERLQKNKKLSWKLFNGAKLNVAPSGYLIESFRRNGYNNVAHIPNSIDLGLYPFKMRSSLKARLLWVRSFSEIYNPALALEVIAELVEQGIDAELCMVGPDKDGSLERCKKLVEERSLPVRFTGRLDKEEWIDLSESYDIFINTTNFDNMPVSVIEAMALGLPVVSTRVGGIPFLLNDKEDAFLVDANDKDGFCEAITKLLEESEEGIRMARNARKKVEKFDWEVVKHLWFEILKA